ncbi:hypothetical protein [Plantibacter flavus]|uniref:hypothetical protein n=1 Tax=Plantibacter flavus TaxID=150123 RepID=UPI0033947AC1
MSNTILPQVTVVRTAEQEQAILEWAAQVRQIHDRDSRPFEEKDPRTDALIQAHNRKYGTGMTEIPADFDAVFIGQQYFTDASELPPLPIPVPAWAVETRVDKRDYPVIEIEWRSEVRTSGGGRFSAYIEQSISVAVEDEDPSYSHGLPVRSAGDVIADPVGVFVPQDRDYLSADDAISFAFVINEVGEELAQYELAATRAERGQA